MSSTTTHIETKKRSAERSRSKLVPELRFKEFDGEWIKKKLGEVSDFLDGRRKPIKIGDRAKMKGEYPYYGASGIIDYVNNYIFDEELILLGEDGENIVSRNSPLAFRVSGKCWINNHAHVIVPKKGVDIDFLTHNLEKINYLIYNTGTAQPKLNQAVCRSIPSYFGVFPEQQKIASFLSAVDEKIQQLTQKKELLEQYKKGVMQQLFSGKLRFKPDTSATLSVPNKYRGLSGAEDRQNGAEVRNGNNYPDWEEKRLEELSFRIGDGIHSTPKYDDRGSYHFVNGNNLTNGKIIINETTKRVNEEEYLKHNRELGERTILLSINGTIGNIAFYNNERIVLGKSACYININDSVDLNYIYLIIQSRPIINYFISELTGSTIKNLSLKTIRYTPINIPCLEEQQKIATYLSNIDTKIEAVSNQITQTQSFKKGLLQKMFV